MKFIGGKTVKMYNDFVAGYQTGHETILLVARTMLLYINSTHTEHSEMSFKCTQSVSAMNT